MRKRQTKHMEKPFCHAISRKSLAKVLQALGLSVVRGFTSSGYRVWKLVDNAGNDVGLAADNSIFREKVVVMTWLTIRSLVKDICKWASYFATYKRHAGPDEKCCEYTKNPFRGAHSLYEMKVLGELNVE